MSEIEQLAREVGPGGPSRPSELAMNPRNQEAKADRRARLLTAFRSLDASTQATFLELVEDTAGSPGDARIERNQLWGVFQRLYQIVGWEQ